MRRARLCLSALALCLLLCWGLALREAQWLDREYRGVSVRLEKAVAGDTLRAALEKNSDPAIERITAWRRGDVTELRNETLGASARARRVAVLGDMEDVCPMRVITGSLPAPADETGCVIDTGTAMALYRNTDVAGARLCVDGGEYIVRCVAELREPTVLLRDGQADYNNLELICADRASAAAAAETFLLRFGLSEGHTLVESGFYAGLAAGAAALPGWILLLAVLFPLLRAALRRRTIPLQLLLLLAALILTGAALRRALGLELSWPARFLPTRWSDFDFWPGLVREQAAAFDALAFLTPVPRDMLWLSALRRFALLLPLACGGAAVLGCAGHRWLEAAFDTPALGILVLCTAAVTAALTLTGRGFLPTRAFLFACPLWWLLRSAYALPAARAKACPQRL